MSFTIPNVADALVDDIAEVDKVDIDILVAGYERTGMLSGGAVTAQGVPDLTLAVAAGVVIVAGVRATVSSGNVTITAADATNPRFDLVVVNNSGTKSVTAGTAAADPVFPAIPANSAVLAAVYVPANDTAIADNQVTDKRVIVASFGDNIKVELGDDADSVIYYDDTDTFWDLQAVGTGGLMLAFGDSFPSPDAGAVHIWQGTAGTINASGDSGLVLENSTHIILSFLTPNTSFSGLFFGDPEDNDSGRFTYSHSSDQFGYVIAGVTRLRYSAGAFAFQEATLVDVTAGTLNLGFSGTSRIGIDTNGLGFFATTPAARPTGVAVTAVGIHAALVTLGLITA